MWPGKSSKAISAPRQKSRPEFRAAFTLLLLLNGCGGGESLSRNAGYVVRAVHLTDYAWKDRSGTGQPDQFKPEPELEALLGDLTSSPADLLVLRGLGSESALSHLRDALAGGGIAYHPLYVPGPTVYEGIGFLSRTPPEDQLLLNTQIFRIRDRQFQPLAGAVRVGDVWFWNAEMPPPSQSYERRRNKARILAQNIRPLVEAGEAVLLSLHSREDPGSPMIRMLEEAGLQRLPAKDSRGDAWTHQDPDGIHYRMDQWLFASAALLKQVESAEVLDRAQIRTAGKYRHQAVILRRD